MLNNVFNVLQVLIFLSLLLSAGSYIQGTSFTPSNLVKNRSYEFRILAENDIGQSAPLPTREPILCKAPYGKIELFIMLLDSLCD